MFDRQRDYENISSIVFSILIMGFGKESSNVLCKTRNMTQEKFNVHFEQAQSITKSS